MQFMQSTMTLEEIEEFILDRLPGILERDPRFVTFIEGIVAEKFPRRDEFARLLDEVQQHRAETAELSKRVEHIDQRVEHIDQRVEHIDQRVERVEQRVEQVEQRLERVEQRVEHIDQQLQAHRLETAEQFKQVNQRFDALTQRMEEGFRNVQITIDRLGQRWGIRNEALFRQTMWEVLEKSFGARVEERFIGGEQFDCVIIDDVHILIEISASVGMDILKKLQRKRQLYTDETGVTPARFLLAVGTIHSQRANALRAAGFEVIEPEVDE
jgi:hypothetical protein